MLLLIISFVGGVLTVLAPCILPLLPIIVGGSLDGGGTNKRKAFTIIAALGVSVIIFTLLLKASTIFIEIPEYTWKLISGSIVILLGIVTIFPSLWENQLLAKISIRSNILLGKGNQKNNFWGNVIIGASLGPIFSTCSPTYFIVLASVLPVNPVLGMIYLLAFTLGLCLALLVVALIGQKIMSILGIAAHPRGTFKRTLGVIFVLVGIAILTGVDKKIETALLDAGVFDITQIEQKLLETRNEIQDEEAPETPFIDASGAYLDIPEKERRFSRVPEISSPDAFINTQGNPITIASLEGKVVLLDIWTYSCINCQRTLPYLNQWYEKYHDQGFEIIGLHTPEFAFEKLPENVERAVKKFELKYPVVLDNDYSTWRSLKNQYWPRKYLIDIDGFIIYDHIGEGAYEETEQMIQHALKERASRLGEQALHFETPLSSENKSGSTMARSPEVYFGSSRNSLLENGVQSTTGEQNFSLPREVALNRLYLSGSWQINPEYAQNKGAGEIVFPYHAREVHMVAGSEDPIEIEIYQDDTFIKTVSIKNEELYTLIKDGEYGTHLLRIKVPTEGLKAFTFTFG